MTARPLRRGAAPRQARATRKFGGREAAAKDGVSVRTARLRDRRPQEPRANRARYDQTGNQLHPPGALIHINGPQGSDPDGQDDKLR